MQVLRDTLQFVHQYTSTLLKWMCTEMCIYNVFIQYQHTHNYFTDIWNMCVYGQTANCIYWSGIDFPLRPHNTPQKLHTMSQITFKLIFFLCFSKRDTIRGVVYAQMLHFHSAAKGFHTDYFLPLFLPQKDIIELSVLLFSRLITKPKW